MTLLLPENFTIAEREDYWIIRDGNIGTLDLSKRLLFADRETKKLSRQERIEFILEAHAKGQFGALSLPEQHLVIETAYNHKDEPEYKEPITNLQKFLRKQLEQHSLETISYIVTSPEEDSKSIIMHNPGTLHEETLEEQIIGKDGLLTEIPERIQLSEALFKNSDYNKINSVYKWITGSQVNVWRTKEKPKQRERSVVSLATYLGDFYLIVNGGLNLNRPCLGIRKSK